VVGWHRRDFTTEDTENTEFAEKRLKSSKLKVERKRKAKNSVEDAATGKKCGAPTALRIVVARVPSPYGLG